MHTLRFTTSSYCPNKRLLEDNESLLDTCIRMTESPSLFTWNYHKIVNRLWRWNYHKIASWQWNWKLLGHVQLFVTPWSIQSTYSPGQNTGVGSLFLFLESNAGLLHCSQILYQLSHKESPRILEWVADPFSSGSSQPTNWTRVSCIAGVFSRLYSNIK